MLQNDQLFATQQGGPNLSDGVHEGEGCLEDADLVLVVGPESPLPVEPVEGGGVDVFDSLGQTGAPAGVEDRVESLSASHVLKRDLELISVHHIFNNFRKRRFFNKEG